MMKGYFVVDFICFYLRNNQQVFHQVPVDVLSAGPRSAEQIPKKVPDHRQSVQASCVWQETERV